MGRLQWYTTVILGLREQKQKDLKFETSLGYIVVYIVALTVTNETTISQTQKTSIKDINIPV